MATNTDSYELDRKTVTSRLGLKRKQNRHLFGIEMRIRIDAVSETLEFRGFRRIGGDVKFVDGRIIGCKGVW